MNKKTQKNFVYLLIPTTIVIIVWIGVSLYTRAVTSTISQKTTVSLEAIDPEFDISVINSLKKREQINGRVQADEQSSPAAELETQELTPISTPTTGGAL